MWVFFLRIKYFSDKNHFSFMLVIVITAFLAFLPSIHSFFLLDDFFWVSLYKTNTIQDIINHYPLLFRIQCDDYRPLLVYPYVLNSFFGGMDPFGYHLLNIAFHLANTILVDRLIYHITADRKLSLCTAFLFALHPLHVGAVVYISGRTELISSFFAVLSLLLYVRYLNEDSRRYFGLSLLFFTCAMFSKETAITYLGVFLGIRYYIKKNISFTELFAFSISSLSFFLIRQFLVQTTFNKYGFELGAENFIRLFYNYVLIFFPIDIKGILSPAVLSFLMHKPLALGVLSLGLILLLLLLANRFLRNTKLNTGLILLCLFWLVCTFFPIFLMSGDRFAYAPSVASCCITAHVLLSFMKGKSKKLGVLVFLPVAIWGTLFFTWTIDRSVIYNHVGLKAEKLLRDIKAAVPSIPSNSLVFLFNYENKWVRDDTGWLRPYYGNLGKALEVLYDKKNIRVSMVKNIMEDDSILEYLERSKSWKNLNSKTGILVLRYDPLRSKFFDITEYFRSEILAAESDGF